jgi:hypothetical protein
MRTNTSTVLALALVAAFALGCADGFPIDAPDAGIDTGATVDTGAELQPDTGKPGPCCVHYPSGLAVPGCWSCGDGVLRCVGTPCSTASATMPLCSTQPTAAWPLDHPTCD